MDEEYKPTTGETIGQYLKRLRDAAGQTLQEIAKMSSHLSGPQKFTAAWLSDVENDKYDQPGPDRLRTLSGIYSQLLGVNIQEQLLLELAGYKSFQPISQQPDEDDLHRWLRHKEVLALVILVGKLAEAGHTRAVEVLANNAYVIFKAHQPDSTVEHIYDDRLLAQYVQKFIGEAGLK